MALTVAFIVHRLTQRRERDKTVFELHKAVIDSARSVRQAAQLGWTAKSKAKREAAIVETRWQLQRTGALIQQMKKISTPHWMSYSEPLDATSHMAHLRDAITLGDFEDPTRENRPTELSNVETAVATFLDGVDSALFAWIK